MYSKETTAMIALVAAVFSLVCCQVLARTLGQHGTLNAAQLSTGLAICLGGVVVGLLLVLGASLLQDATTGWRRSLGTLGLALGGALLLALLVGRHATRGRPTVQATQESASAQLVAVGRETALLAPGTSR